MADLKPIRIISEININSEQIILAAVTINKFLCLVDASEFVSAGIHDLIDLSSFYIDGPDKQRVINGNAAVGYLFSQGHLENNKFINFLLVKGLINIDINRQADNVQGLAYYNELGIVAVGWEDSLFNRGRELLGIMHELGHIYGVPSEQRLGEDWVKKFARHCPNDCIMFYDLNKKLDKIGLLDKPFCATCLEDLKNYFKDKKVKV